MSGRSQALAEQYRQANTEFVTTLEGLSDEQWHQPCKDQARTVGILAHHIATIHPIIVSWVQQFANGQAIEGVTMDMADQMNAQHAHEHAAIGKAETLELQHKNVGEAVKIIEGLSDSELDTVAYLSLYDTKMTTEQLIASGLTGHVQTHLNSIKEAIN